MKRTIGGHPQTLGRRSPPAPPASHSRASGNPQEDEIPVPFERERARACPGLDPGVRVKHGPNPRQKSEGAPLRGHCKGCSQTPRQHPAAPLLQRFFLTHSHASSGVFWQCTTEFHRRSPQSPSGGQDHPATECDNFVRSLRPSNRWQASTMPLTKRIESAATLDMAQVLCYLSGWCYIFVIPAILGTGLALHYRRLQSCLLSSSTDSCWGNS
jgi:hypothetical protein